MSCLAECYKVLLLHTDVYAHLCTFFYCSMQNQSLVFHWLTAVLELLVELSLLTSLQTDLSALHSVSSLGRHVETVSTALHVHWNGTPHQLSKMLMYIKRRCCVIMGGQSSFFAKDWTIKSIHTI